jgi:hypothetical protein
VAVDASLLGPVSGEEGDFGLVLAVNVDAH